MKKLFSALVAAFYSGLLLAQDGTGTKNINVDIKTDGGTWYTSPWVWIVGAAVFILLLVALTRSGRRAD